LSFAVLLRKLQIEEMLNPLPVLPEQSVSAIVMAGEPMNDGT